MKYMETHFALEQEHFWMNTHLHVAIIVDLLQLMPFGDVSPAFIVSWERG